MKQKIHIQDYQVHLPPLGEGTFGTVYRATYRGISERALKLFKPETVDLSTMARELEKLSSLSEHPGIVTLHDFDLLTNTPYYAMSLHAEEQAGGVWRSRSLNDVCGKLDARENARLIDQIAAAMAYLHRHQIVHCDLKPTNVMLTDESPPRIKICDFGQSRASNRQNPDAAGTPLYSSPEQLREPGDSAEGKGFRWDVYSFGVLAYRLVTGKLPRLQNLVESGSDEDFEASIVETDTLESSVADTKSGETSRIADLLEREPEIEWPADAKLDSRRKAIVARCLALDPSGRPTDMREVNGEIERAMHERRAIRSRNWSLLFGSITALAILATGWAFYQSRQAELAGESEQIARQDAEELVNFILFDLRERLGPVGMMEVLEHIADDADTYIENLSKDMRTVQSLKLLANLLRGRGDAAFVRGLHDEAVDAYQKAFNILDQLDQNGQGDEAMTFRSSLILVSLGDCFRARDDFGAAADFYVRALDLRDPNRPDGPGQERYLSSTAEIHVRRAELLVADGKHEQAIRSLDQALELARRVRNLPNQANAANNQLALVRIFNARAGALLAAGEKQNAADAYQRAVDAGRQSLSLFERSVNLRAAVAEALHALGQIHLDDGQSIEALIFLRQELLLREEIQKREPRDIRRRFELANCHASVAQCYNLDLPASRALALENLMRAIRLLETMRNPLQFSQERESLIQAYRDRTSAILELEE